MPQARYRPASAVEGRESRVQRDHAAKPSNILIEERNGKPSPKVIDFGVSKAIGKDSARQAILTQHGAMLGTPAYMSPEQTQWSSRNIDAATDVYSLGVLLYELLAGSLPFDPEKLSRAGPDGTRRIIQEDEPTTLNARLARLGEQAGPMASLRNSSLQALRKELRGDLNWIALKAMEKDRARRYASASDLAADIRRHLRDQPVIAGPPSAAYRFGKFLRRNKMLMGALTSSLLVSLLGSAISTTLDCSRVSFRDAPSSQGLSSAALEEGDNPALRFLLAEATRPIICRLLFRLDGNQDRFLCIDINPDGIRILTTSGGEKGWLWYARSGKPLARLEIRSPHHHPVIGELLLVAFSPEESHIVTALENRSGRIGVQIWDASSGQRLHSLLFSKAGARFFKARPAASGFPPNGGTAYSLFQDGSAPFQDQRRLPRS